MCGIAGSTGSSTPERREAVDRQLQTLLRRGPDARGFLPSEGAMVGQTRLAVMDPSGGDPPLTDESGRIRAVLNGEIYNFRALQSLLRGRGHTLTTHCDTEVLAHLAEDHEPAALAATLQGMFAFAVWDARQERLVLGRDRLGKKPLYYWTDGRELVFGSEIKAVLADPRVPRRLAAGAVASYLAHGYVPTPGTFFEGIVSLPPASVLVWQDGVVEVDSYWTVSTAAAPLPGSAAEHALEVRRCLETAVRDRLVADVPVGAFLSGGVDSSTVVGLMASMSTQPVRTFCVGFDDPAYDERRWARLVAERFSTDHTEVVVRPDASSLLDDVLSACDQPFADSSAVPTLLLSQSTREHVTVALSGDGGDEVFAGYDRFAAALALHRTRRVLPAGAGAQLRKLGRRFNGTDLRSTSARAGRFLKQVGVPLPDAYTSLVQLFDDELLDRLAPGSVPATKTQHREIWQEAEGLPLLNRLLDLNRRTYLVDDLLVKADRMSMFHALEVRSPLLDHRLVELSLRVPPQEHLRGRSTKMLLKAAVRDFLPSEVLDRPKRGFGVPLDRWFRDELADEARRRLTSPGARLAAHVDPRVVTELVQQHQAGRAAHGQRLWALLMLERFLEREGW